jgi:DNA replication protein DnaC
VSNAINRHNELRELLERLKLSGMTTSFADLALKAAKEGLSHEAYLHELAKREEALRNERRTERLLRQSGLPLSAPLIWDASHRRCNCTSSG